MQKEMNNSEFIQVNNKRRSPKNKKKSGGKYLPPHLRKKNKENKKKAEIQDFNSIAQFPSLTNNTSDTPIEMNNNCSFIDSVKKAKEQTKDEREDLPYGWVKLKQDGTVIHSMTPEEIKERDEQHEYERRHLIFEKMRESYNYYRKIRHEDEIYGYFSDKTENSEYSNDNDDYNDDDSHGEDDYSDY